MCIFVHSKTCHKNYQNVDSADLLLRGTDRRVKIKPRLCHRLSQDSTAAILVEAGNHKVALSATNKPEIDLSSSRNLRMRIPAVMNDDCRLQQ